MSLRDELQAIYDQHGRLTPELVVEVARPDDHPLHATVFDRPPNEAAEAWYRERAHELIQRVKVRYTVDDKPREVRAFQAVRGDDGYTYEPVEKVAADPRMRQVVLREMEREWQALKGRYEEFEEFIDLVRRDLSISS